MKNFIAACALLLPLTIVACGGGGDDRKMSSLTATDVQELCEDQDPFSKSDVEGLVTALCVSSLENCTPQILASCIEEGSGNATEPETCEAPSADEMAELVGCDVSVDQWYDCQMAILGSFDKYKGAACGTAVTQPSVPAKCEVVQTKCPQLLSGEDEVN